MDTSGDLEVSNDNSWVESYWGRGDVCSIVSVLLTGLKAAYRVPPE